jgi:hypothetical protein
LVHQQLPLFAGEWFAATTMTEVSVVAVSCLIAAGVALLLLERLPGELARRPIAAGRIGRRAERTTSSVNTLNSK